MKKRLKEMEEEASALREMQAKVEKEMGAVQGTFSPSFFKHFCRIYYRFSPQPFGSRFTILIGSLSRVNILESVIGGLFSVLD